MKKVFTPELTSIKVTNNMERNFNIRDVIREHNNKVFSKKHFTIDDIKSVEYQKRKKEKRESKRAIISKPIHETCQFCLALLPFHNKRRICYHCLKNIMEFNKREFWDYSLLITEVSAIIGIIIVILIRVLI